MERLLLIKLKAKAPFHLGERGVGIEETSEIVHSDTLFGALCWCWTLLTGEEPEEFLRPFREGRPPFLFSSAFPFWGEMLFVPRPLAPLPVEGTEEFKQDVQKVDFLSLRAVAEMGRRTIPHQDLKLLAGKRLLVLSKEAQQLDNTDKAPWAVIQVPRVALDRVASASEIFHAGRLVFAEKSGLYLLVRILDPDALAVQKLQALFRLMGDEGLGGERSCGYGFFTPDFQEIELNVPQTSQQLLLSLYNPKNSQELEGLDLSRSAYKLVRRRGWVFSTRAKNLQTQSVNFFVESSVFRRSKPEYSSVWGRLVEVLQAGTDVPHPVYRNGLGFFIGWRSEEAQP
jgi:CRISPR-associated protein Csm4